MNQNIWLPVLTCLLLIFSACKPDPPVVDDDEPAPPIEVYAGVYDASFYYREFSPPLAINLSWDNQQLYASGSESLDLSGNGRADINLQLNLLNSDSLHLLNGGMPNPFPAFYLQELVDLSFTVYAESYPIGMGQSQTAYFVDTLAHGTRIDDRELWGAQGFGVKMWGEHPGVTGLSFGGWYSVNGTRYVGLRYLSNRYGWIEIEGSDRENPRILSFALQY